MATSMATPLSKLFFFLFLTFFIPVVLGRPWVETNECISACGLDRRGSGFSSDSSLDCRLIHRLCSQECYLNCPNTVNLYFSVVAAGEGVLPNLCQEKSFRRENLEKVDVVIAPSASSNDNHIIRLDPVIGKNI